ncbi:leucine-rich repeat domain-containing protein [Porphyromonas sp. COT-108 OH1349]|uniref:leucine-rich repeat domain-containing protein n=1 Tax=Porphyromonas sp. COT-108 OH1349 TaxID=1537504 RepID=UPI00052D9403|nr:leucine-rich repeat domain-containing protein [Porphyromonas sp. COT-108 OH1349]KGN71729.1 hypothetical protein JT26_00160 [Porphyromonas sp. COT-108 OH1349]
MERISIKFLLSFFLLSALLLAGCQNERESLLPGQKERQLTFTASMPQDGISTRVALENDAVKNILSARWESGDKVTFVFEQGARLTEPVEVVVGSIGQEGKSAKLDIEVPEIIDTAEEYTIHAFCGVPGEGVSIRNKEILLDILPLRGDRLSDIAVPVLSKLKVEPEDMAASGEMLLPFAHLGSVEYVDLKNSSDAELKVLNCHLYGTDPGADEWRYLPGNGKHYLYKPMTDEVVSADGDKPNPLEAAGSGIGIAPGATHTFAVWHRPTGKNIPEFGISMQTEHGTKLSANKKRAKAFSMTAGKAYRVQAEWKENSLRILGDGVEEDLPSISLTTERAVGGKIWLLVDADDADRPDVWIDLNNNNTKDAGESVTTFDEKQVYTLGSQTITVYGKITVFNCSAAGIKTLDLSKSPALKELLCFENPLASLDVSKNTELEKLECCDIDELTALDVSKNTKLTYLDCSGSSISSLDVSENIRLTKLVCHSNPLNSLDVSKNTALSELLCNKIGLKSLDVSSNADLQELYCNGNSLTSLDVSKNPALIVLSCSENFLPSLDVSGNKKMTYLDCRDNKELSSLKIPNSINNALFSLNCKLDAETLDEIFKTLPDVTGQSIGDKKVFVAGNPGADACHPEIATQKGWKVDVVGLPLINSMVLTTEKAVGEKINLSIDADDADRPEVWIDLNNNKKKDAGESVTQFGKHQEYTLGAKTITIYGKVTTLRCEKNGLTALDASKNIALKDLNCRENKLLILDVSKNPALVRLSCNNNLLNALDVSENVALKYLYCGNNKISRLDLSNNKNLTYLESRDNKELTHLEVPGTLNYGLVLSNCKLSESVLDEIFRTLPDVRGLTGNQQILIAGNPGAAACHPDIATYKGWKVDVAGLPSPWEMVLTTEKPVGSKITLLLDADAPDRPDVWIDLNDNDVKDAGEAVTVFGRFQEYTLRFSDFTIYGKVTALNCSNQEIIDLDVSDNPALRYLGCYNNKLTDLDVSDNTGLKELYCQGNRIETLDVSHNTALEGLGCYNNKLTSLNVSYNTALKGLYCHGNRIETLDVSKNTALERLQCHDNLLTSLDVSYNPALEILKCNNNKLTSLNVRDNTALKELYCYGNRIETLDVSKNTDLTDLHCDRNKLTTLDVSKNIMLLALMCYENQLTSLDVSKNTDLIVLYCDRNNLTSLDLSNNILLTELNCFKNQLVALDVSKNTALEHLDCYVNNLTSLDLSNNKNLTVFGCDNNKDLSSLKISGSINDMLYCRNCKLSAETLNEIFRTLPDVTGVVGGEKTIYIHGNPGTDECDKKIATDKGWTVSLDPVP